MAYTKTNWENAPSTATPINAARLNNLEDGVADAHALLGSRTVSIDANGVPYFDPVDGTHFLLRGADGIPYIQPTIAADVTRVAGFLEIA